MSQIIKTAGTSFNFLQVSSTSNPVSMSINTGYITTGASLVQLVLPVTSAAGSRIEIVGFGSGGWTLTQNATQYIDIISSTTTIGTGGSLSSTNSFDSIELICVEANKGWTVVNGTGNWTIV